MSVQSGYKERRKAGCIYYKDRVQGGCKTRLAQLYDLQVEIPENSGSYMKNLIYKLTLILSMILLTSCATLSSVVSAPADEGISQTFAEDNELVKAAALASVKNLDVSIEETDNTSTGYSIIFTKAVSALSWGEFGRVLVVMSENGSSEVFVHSEKRSRFQLTGSDEEDFAKKIFSGMSEILKKS